MKQYLIGFLCLMIVLSGCTVTVLPPDEPDGYGGIEGTVYISVPKSIPLSAMSLEMEEELDVIIAPAGFSSADYQPLPGAKVTLQAHYGEIHGIKTTDYREPYRGSFGFYNIPSGSKYLYIEHPALRQTYRIGTSIRKDHIRQLDHTGGVGYYIIVGIDQYQYMTQGNSDVSVYGADAMCDLLRDENTMIGSYRVLINHQATYDNIKDAILDAAAAANAEDYLVFYFSGYADSAVHDGEGGVKPLEHIVPYDGKDWLTVGNNLITDGELADWFKAFPNKNITVILETSYSGDFINGKISRQSIEPELELQALKQAGYSVLTSTQEGQQQAVRDPRGYMVTLTSYIVDALDSMAADSDRDDKVTIEELYNWVRNRMIDIPNTPKLNIPWGVTPPVVFRTR